MEATLARLPERPLVAPWFRVAHAEDRLLLEHGGALVELAGKAVGTLLPALLPLLDGAHTVADVVERLGPAVEPSVQKALDLLNDHGLLVEGPGVQSGCEGADAARYVAASVAGTTLGEAHSRLAAVRVGVAGAARAAEHAIRLLASAGVAVDPVAPSSPLDGVDLLLVVPSADDVSCLADVNRRRLADGVPWLQVLPHDGRFAAVGPLFLPATTACHECYRIRRGATSGFEDDFPLVDAQPPRAAAPEALGAIAAGLAALLALRWLAGHDRTVPGSFLAVEAGTLSVTRHRVLRVPRCPACGPESGLPNPWFKERARAA
jgi:bacteriocin biosynthesis cyclodehydratase domain-containing protein